MNSSEIKGNGHPNPSDQLVYRMLALQQGGQQQAHGHAEAVVTVAGGIREAALVAQRDAAQTRLNTLKARLEVSLNDLKVTDVSEEPAPRLHWPKDSLSWLRFICALILLLGQAVSEWANASMFAVLATNLPMEEWGLRLLFLLVLPIAVDLAIGEASKPIQKVLLVLVMVSGVVGFVAFLVEFCVAHVLEPSVQASATNIINGKDADPYRWVLLVGQILASNAVGVVCARWARRQLTYRCPTPKFNPVRAAIDELIERLGADITVCYQHLGTIESELCLVRDGRAAEVNRELAKFENIKQRIQFLNQ